MTDPDIDTHTDPAAGYMNGLCCSGCGYPKHTTKEHTCDWCRHMSARADEAEAKLAKAVEALEKIANHLPSFDYVGCDEFGPRSDFPGSPYDRGKADGCALLSEIAQKTLKGGEE